MDIGKRPAHPNLVMKLKTVCCVSKHSQKDGPIIIHVAGERDCGCNRRECWLSAVRHQPSGWHHCDHGLSQLCKVSVQVLLIGNTCGNGRVHAADMCALHPNKSNGAERRRMRVIISTPVSCKSRGRKTPNNNRHEMRVKCLADAGRRVCYNVQAGSGEVPSRGRGVAVRRR